MKIIHPNAQSSSLCVIELSGPVWTGAFVSGGTALSCSVALLLWSSVVARARRDDRFACSSASPRPTTAFSSQAQAAVHTHPSNLPRQSQTETPRTRAISAIHSCSSLALSLSLTRPYFFIPPFLPLSVFCMSPPPSLVHLTLVTAVLHIHRFSDLSSVPDHLVLHLFQKILAAGKLTDYVLRMFVATGNDEVLQLVKALRIRPVSKPILPTRCSDKEF